MIILFGTKTLTKNLGKLENCQCQRCNNVSDWDFIEFRHWFTLFFIPVFPISKKNEILQCPICSQAYKVPEKTDKE